MATIKSYTDLEQSKRLAEILPLESADMAYWKKSYQPNDYAIMAHHTKELQEGFEARCIEYIPAWSLVALISVLPTIDDEFEPQLRRSLDKYRCTYEGEEDSSGLWRVAGNPVDACYEMILKLHELNLL